MKTILSLEHAFVRRDGKYILTDASLKIEKGGHIAIIGPNGAGKSTLIDVLSRSIYPLALDEYVNEAFGERKWIASELKKLIGVVSERNANFLDTPYTVREIVCSALYSSLGFDFHHKVDDADWDKADEQIRKVGLQAKADMPMKVLSSGEKRRALLARTNMTDPPLLLLDEASSALDFPSRADLRELVSSYAKDRTIVMVTHELSEIIPEINRIILMKDSRIVMDGKKEEVLTEYNLSKLYGRKVFLSVNDGIYTAWC